VIPRVPVRWVELRDAEIEDLHERRRRAHRDDEVLGLQIAVHDPGVVGCLNPSHAWLDHVGELARIDGPSRASR